MHRNALAIVLALLFAPLTGLAASVDPARAEAIRAEFLAIQEQIDLTDEQRAQLEPILAEHAEAARAVLAEHGIDPAAGRSGGHADPRKLRALAKDLQPLREETDRKIATILTPDQLATYRAIQEEQRAAMRDKLRGRAGR